MKAGSLFSGIGGIDLGLERAGIKIAWQVEIDPFCRRVLEKHWPNVPKYSDIRGVKGSELETVDIVAGGPPCQPVSLAGKRRGTADDRWLWEDTLRIVGKLGPRWCLFENPPGIVSLGLDDVLVALEALGYSCQAAVIPACAVGATHRRDRVWILAHSAHGQDVANAQSAECQRCQSTRARRNGLTDSGETMADTDSAGFKKCNTSAVTKGQRYNPGRAHPGYAEGKSESRLGGVLDGLSDWLDGYKWPAPLGCEQYEWEPPRVTIERIPHRRQRLQALGNAVVPQIVEVIGRVIMQIERDKKEAQKR